MEMANQPIRHNPLWEDFRNHAIPRIASLLHTTAADVMLLHKDTLNTSHSNTDLRDNAVKREGFAEGLPALLDCPLHGTKGQAFGLTLFECRGKPELRYVICLTMGSYGQSVFNYFCRKGEAVRVVRHCTEMSKQAMQKNAPPVLEGTILPDMVESVIGFLKAEKKIKSFGVTMNRGILLDGPPGNGKTMLCRYIQRLCFNNGISCGSVSSPAIDKAYKDNQLDELFSLYQVTFFDDIDIAYLSRSHGDGKMACALLTAMDGMSGQGALQVRIFTTNEKVESLDLAFVRPGRIDRKITLDKPSAKHRRRLAATWDGRITDNIDVDRLVELTEDCSCAEFEAVKGFLVQDHLFGRDEWDLDRAVKLAKGEKLNERKVMGFTNPAVAGDTTVRAG